MRRVRRTRCRRSSCARCAARATFAADAADPCAEIEAALFCDDGEALLTARRLMNALDAPMRRLAVLHFMDQLTQEELAAELGVSRRTIGKRLKALHVRARVLVGPKGAS
jgi:DNA-directed RNA polymerase specialized sigma24 family protein